MFLVDFARLTEHKDYLDFNFSFLEMILIKFIPVYFIFWTYDRKSEHFLSLHTLKSN